MTNILYCNTKLIWDIGYRFTVKEISTLKIVILTVFQQPKKVSESLQTNTKHSESHSPVVFFRAFFDLDT